MSISGVIASFFCRLIDATVPISSSITGGIIAEIRVPLKIYESRTGVEASIVTSPEAHIFFTIETASSGELKLSSIFL